MVAKNANIQSSARIEPAALRRLFRSPIHYTYIYFPGIILKMQLNCIVIVLYHFQVQYVLSVLESPFSDDVEPMIEPQSKSGIESQSESTEVESGSDHIEFTFDHKAPRWAHQLRVT